MDRGIVNPSLQVGLWSGVMVKIGSQSQEAQRKIYRARQFWMLNPWAGSYAHFPLISSFSFIIIMQSISQAGKVLCILFFLTTFQNSTPSDRTPFCCQWYDANPLPPLGGWRVSAFGTPLGQLGFLKLHYSFPMSMWRQYSQLQRNERYENID